MITQPSHQELSTLLAECKSVAVIGASPNPHRASNWISKFLMDQNYNVIPVNPGHSQLFGVKCYPDLISIQEEVDIVNIYRRSEAVLPIIEDAIQRDDIKLIWMQDNVYNPEAAELATEKGIPTIMNDCIYRFLMR